MGTCKCPVVSCGKVSYDASISWFIPQRTQAFVRKSDLQRHYRIHTGQRPFVCPEEGCHRTFVQKGGLKEHSGIHSSEKRHQCQDCSKPFADVSEPIKHASQIDVASSRQACPAIDVVIVATRSTVVYHAERGIPSIYCIDCQASNISSFLRDSALRKHLSTHGSGSTGLVLNDEVVNTVRPNHQAASHEVNRQGSLNNQWLPDRQVMWDQGHLADSFSFTPDELQTISQEEALADGVSNQTLQRAVSKPDGQSIGHLLSAPDVPHFSASDMAETARGVPVVDLSTQRYVTEHLSSTTIESCPSTFFGQPMQNTEMVSTSAGVNVIFPQSDDLQRFGNGFSDTSHPLLDMARTPTAHGETEDANIGFHASTTAGLWNQSAYYSLQGYPAYDMDQPEINRALIRGGRTPMRSRH